MAPVSSLTCNASVLVHIAIFAWSDMSLTHSAVFRIGVISVVGAFGIDGRCADRSPAAAEGPQALFLWVRTNLDEDKDESS